MNRRSSPAVLLIAIASVLAVCGLVYFKLRKSPNVLNGGKGPKLAATTSVAPSFIKGQTARKPSAKPGTILGTWSSDDPMFPGATGTFEFSKDGTYQETGEGPGQKGNHMKRSIVGMYKFHGRSISLNMTHSKFSTNDPDPNAKRVVEEQNARAAAYLKRSPAISATLTWQDNDAVLVEGGGRSFTLRRQGH